MTRTIRRRTPERRAADREAVLRTMDGTRTFMQAAGILERGAGDVHQDVLALRRAGHSITCPNGSKLMRDGGGAVYRHYDAEGRLLYVGCSANVPQRTAQHAGYAGWFRQIVRIEIEHFSDLIAALEAERIAIRTEAPMFNVVGKPVAAEAAQ